MKRAGVTLLELVVVVVILGLLAGVVGLSWRRDAWTAPSEPVSDRQQAVLTARREALASGRSVTVVVDMARGEGVVMALPDGRILGAEELGFDPLSGRRSAADSVGGAAGSTGH